MTAALVLALVVALVLVFRRRRPKTRFRCATCRHLLVPFDDGVRCGAGGREVFKTPVHISNCMDYDEAS